LKQLIALLMCGPTGNNISRVVVSFRVACENEAARAADASREANGAVYGERLK
jgi:hypothetical protein